ncbi:hypothetical protein CERSUDRAFT_93616 [Gelatoporia subvermispora B]|uniref:Uncharacterized protein n=1 Tax=Ceriporiopsis subvermispora (strain B) TaxID=914234 RepID=M2R0Q4_CERS8|nr:hypothetical protein CERSUDRAFT_93616 [Gelatoporia subvermispora B]
MSQPVHISTEKIVSLPSDELHAVLAVDTQASPDIPVLALESPLDHSAPYDMFLGTLARRSPQAIYACLANVAHQHTAGPEAIAQLVAILESSGENLDDVRKALADPHQYHCRRCHKDYYAAEDGLNACVIYHDPSQRVKSGIIEYSVFPCCNKYERLHATECYRGPHASDVANVDYRSSSAVSCETSRCRFVKI